MRLGKAVIHLLTALTLGPELVACEFIVLVGRTQHNRFHRKGDIVSQSISVPFEVEDNVFHSAWSLVESHCTYVVSQPLASLRLQELLTSTGSTNSPLGNGTLINTV